ncbi:MAG: AAA family ATPase [Proteobacteria bacterium]|nr:AAA family ATPase [Pseudomonadota bacterium]
MARLLTPLPRHSISPGQYGELQVLLTLEDGLSDAYALFHSVEFQRLGAEGEQHGELDIVLVNQSGDVLLMEVKCGAVDVRAEGIFKTYKGATRNVVGQVSLQYGALRSRLSGAGLPVQVSHLLVLPDAQAATTTVQWPRERIVDSTQIENLLGCIREILGPGLPGGDTQQRVLEFFANRLRIVPDVSALAGRLETVHTKLSAGLATWVPRVTSPSGVIRVVATAGSGKTQLALRLLRQADALQRRAAYFCFNRALADHMGRIAPVRTIAQTWHEYALGVGRSKNLAVDLDQPGAFEQISSYCIAALQECTADLDLIVLDEMQDLQADWVQALLSRLRPDGQAVLLEDPSQRLYTDREEFDIPGAVTVATMENFRSPRVLVQLINALRLTDSEVEPMSVHDGVLSDPIVYRSTDEIAPCTAQGIRRCIERGFAIGDIAVISMRGRERSELLNLERLGDWSLRRFTGTFGEGGEAIWHPGELLIDSVRRFKGQAAPAIVLTECDLAGWDALTRHLLFVGLTRARMHLEWVISESSERLLQKTFVAPDSA